MRPAEARLDVFGWLILAAALAVGGASIYFCYVDECARDDARAEEAKP